MSCPKKIYRNLKNLHQPSPPLCEIIILHQLASVLAKGRVLMSPKDAKVCYLEKDSQKKQSNARAVLHRNSDAILSPNTQYLN